ncbi:MAG: tetratricopeptide repeat protein [Thermoplasmatota archaeon]
MSGTVERLRERGFAQGAVADALDAVPRAPFLPARYRAHADLDVPLPTGRDDDHAGFSPRAAALLLLALDVPTSGTTLIVGEDSGYLAALAARVASRGEVVFVPQHGSNVSAVARRLSTARVKNARAVAEAPFSQGPFDRILLAEETAVVPTGARAALADQGSLLCRVPRNGRVEIFRTTRSGGEYGEVLLGDLSPVAHPLGVGVEEPWPMRRLFGLEEALRRAWDGRAGTPEEAEFSRAVDETWREEPEGDSGREAWSIAHRLFHVGYVVLMAGDFETAEDAFAASLAEAPSAESHTFLGWAMSFTGRYEEAIAACRRASDLDPTFGNALNDIGAYLLELGRPEEAVSWLQRAMSAPRYAARAYPYANLARARLMQGDRDAARHALEEALAIDADYEPARELLRRLDGRDADADEDEADDDRDPDEMAA